LHVSGHAASDELAEMIRTVRPRHFTPVHGEFRHLALHKRIAENNGVSSDVINIVEDGDTLELVDGKVRRGSPVPAGMVLVDGLGVGDVGPVVLRDRRVLAGDGILVCVVSVDQHGELVEQPQLISRGFVYEQESRDLLAEASELVAAAVEHLEDDQVTDRDTVKKACRRALGEFVWRSTRRRPMLLPIVIEV
jgi:ribonuclease J